MNVSEPWQVPETLMQMFRLTTDRPGIPDWEPDDTTAVLNIGCGEKYIYGATHLDLPEWDADKEPIPCDDGTFTAIYAVHFLEHIQDPVAMLREFQRALQPGGHANIGLPYYTSQGAFHDLDHKHFFCEETWRHTFSNPYYDKDHEGWKFRVGANYIMGIVERNMMLITQLIREP